MLSIPIILMMNRRKVLKMPQILMTSRVAIFWKCTLDQFVKLRLLGKKVVLDHPMRQELA